MEMMMEYTPCVAYQKLSPSEKTALLMDKHSIEEDWRWCMKWTDSWFIPFTVNLIVNRAFELGGQNCTPISSACCNDDTEMDCKVVEDSGVSCPIVDAGRTHTLSTMAV